MNWLHPPSDDSVQKLKTSFNLLLQVGFDSGDKVHYYSLPSSGSASVINLTNESNVGYPGKFIFQIGIAGDNSTEIEVPGKFIVITVECRWSLAIFNMNNSKVFYFRKLEQVAANKQTKPIATTNTHLPFTNQQHIFFHFIPPFLSITLVNSKI